MHMRLAQLWKSFTMSVDVFGGTLKDCKAVRELAGVRYKLKSEGDYVQPIGFQTNILQKNG